MKKLLIGSLLLLSLGVQAEEPADESNKVILTINGENITIADMITYRQVRTGPALPSDPAMAQNQILNEMLSTIMLSQEAKKAGLDKNEETQRAFRLAQMIILRDAELNVMMEKQEVSEEDLRKAYAEAFPTETKNEYLVRHILVPEEEQARELLKQLDEGANFEELAKEKSTGPSAPKGGTLGWINEDIVVPEFAASVTSLEKGKYTDSPVKTKFGWHVILLEDTRETKPADPPPFDEVKFALTEKLKAEGVQQELSKLRETLKIESPEGMVTINQPEKAAEKKAE